jgi:putative restriction endonuclease
LVDEPQVRAALFEWLRKESARNGGIFKRDQLLNGFSVGGERIALVGPRGIWKPKQFAKIPISFTTFINGPYPDRIEDDGLISYHYQGDDPASPDNVGLRQAMLEHTPLVYFLCPTKNSYTAYWPAYIVGDSPGEAIFKADPKSLYEFNSVRDETEAVAEDERAYRVTAMRQRLHQATFRVRVLGAYESNCTVCHLKHTELLDAAHIIADGKPHGEPVVPNGLSLCKIHHGAYDANIIGITPDYIIKVRDDILDEHDGPMLKHGLQEHHGQKIILPKHKSDWPDRERLERRHEEFSSIIR